MNYIKDPAASGEMLRLVLQKMTQHPAAFTPLNFAVWYEHAAGINPALSNALHPLLENAGKLNDDLIEKLYAEHVSECNTNLQQMLRNEIRDLLGKVNDSTAEASNEAERFNDSLQDCGNSLRAPIDASTLDGLVSRMSLATNHMQSSVSLLRDQLEASRAEVQQLYVQLESARGEALTDPLTGILNRRGFELTSKAILEDEHESGKTCTLVMLDIDHFKKINDTYGHLFGDKVIMAVATILKSKVKGQDAVARMGGEEFAILLPETSAEGARILSEQIRLAIERGRIRKHDTNEQIDGVTISIGIASHDSEQPLDILIDQADKALYASKQGGRNRVTLYRNEGAKP